MNEDSELTQIDYYFSTLSPWAYLAGTRLEQIAEKHGATITYKPIDLMNVFSRTGGTAPADRHPSRMAYREQELHRWSRATGLKIVSPKPTFWPTNPAPSSYAIIAAQEAGGGDLGALCHGIMSAIWADDKDISDEAVIKSLLEASGFDPSLTESGLLLGAERYARNTEEAVERGVFGAPFYIVDGTETFWGQDRLGMLSDHLAGAI